MNSELVRRARDSLPRRLNAGILMGDGGFCVLGWMLLTAGFHPITLYANTLGVVDPALGGPAIDVVARVFDLARDDVVSLARINDATPGAERTAAVRARFDELLADDGSPHVVSSDESSSDQASSDQLFSDQASSDQGDA